jgi:epsilon-lactone hydrolase
MQSFAALLLASATLLRAQEPTPTTASAAPTRDTSYVDENGTSHITRVVPVPSNISPEAQKSLSRRVPDTAHPDEPLAQRRARMVENAARASDAWRKICTVNVADSEIAGVAVHIVTPADRQCSWKAQRARWGRRGNVGALAAMICESKCARPMAPCNW